MTAALVAVLALVATVALLWIQDERYRAELARLHARATGSKQVQSLLGYTECILASITSGVLVVDTLARVTLMNREAEAIFGCGPGTLIGKPLYRVEALKTLMHLVNEVRSAMPSSQRCARQYEFEIVVDSGEKIPLGVSVNALTGDRGAVLGYVVVFRDLTENRAMLADLERSRKLSALGAMASGAAHNFSNTLATILGRVQLLLRYPPPYERLIEGLRIVEKCALDGVATVKRIADFARQNPTTDLYADVDVTEIVQDVVAFTRTRWDEQAKEKGIVFDFQVELGTVGPVRGSSSELREVLINLVLNAIDAMPAGGSIRVGTASDAKGVRIWVSDSGPGIPEEVRGRLFEPFFTTKGKRGTGLGLFESYNIVQRHRGRLTYTTAVGHGTTFTIELPPSPGVNLGPLPRV